MQGYIKGITLGWKLSRGGGAVDTVQSWAQSVHSQQNKESPYSSSCSEFVDWAQLCLAWSSVELFDEVVSNIIVSFWWFPVFWLQTIGKYSHLYVRQSSQELLLFVPLSLRQTITVILWSPCLSAPDDCDAWDCDVTIIVDAFWLTSWYLITVICWCLQQIRNNTQSKFYNPQLQWTGCSFRINPPHHCLSLNSSCHCNKQLYLSTIKDSW